MKKREIIGIVLLVISIFILLLSLMINISIEKTGEKNEEPEKNISLTKSVFLNFEQRRRENLNGTG
jgi:hypothetical protein